MYRHRGPAAVLLLAAALALAGCGADAPGDPGGGQPPRAPESADESAAVAVFEAYLEAVEHGDARAACQLLTGKAAEAHGCATAPRIPRDIRRAGAPVEPVRVRDAEHYDAQMHLSAEVDPARRAGGSLVAFLDRHVGRWVIKEALVGSYG